MNGGIACHTSTGRSTAAGWSTGGSWRSPPATASPRSASTSSPTRTTTRRRKGPGARCTTGTGLSTCSRPPACSRARIAAAPADMSTMPDLGGLLDKSPVAPPICNCCVQWLSRPDAPREDIGGESDVTAASGPTSSPTRSTHFAPARGPVPGHRRPGRGAPDRPAGGCGVPTNAVRGTHNASSAGPDLEHPGRRCPRPCPRPPASWAPGEPSVSAHGRRRVGRFDSGRARP